MFALQGPEKVFRHVLARSGEVRRRDGSVHQTTVGPLHPDRGEKNPWQFSCSFLCWAVERDGVADGISSIELILPFSILQPIFDADIDEPLWAFPLK
jgi:hypothetical protein